MNEFWFGVCWRAAEFFFPERACDPMNSVSAAAAAAAAVTAEG